QEFPCTRMCTKEGTWVEYKDPLDCAASDQKYVDVVCKGNMVYEQNLADPQDTGTLEKSCAWGCTYGSCLAPILQLGTEKYCTKEGEQLLRYDGACIVECREGKYRETPSCGHIDVVAYNNTTRLDVYKALSLLPASVFTDMNPVARTFWQPYTTVFYSEVNGRRYQSWPIGDYKVIEDTINLANTTPQIVIHEFFHAWAGQRQTRVPEQLPFSYLINSSVPQLTYPALVPPEYLTAVGCETKEGVSVYSVPPVTGYGGSTSDNIPCHEDFADSASWYVTNACELKRQSPKRYEYFRDKVFNGKEYLPADGCGKG
ncbi:MAG: hypothetical protein AAB649_05135, partial [Patescibacteria group bacterium]